MSITTINELPPEMIKEIFKHSRIEDAVSMRAVCRLWNTLSRELHIGVPLLPSPALVPDLVKESVQHAKLSSEIDELEKGVTVLASRVSRLSLVQDRMEGLSLAAACTTGYIASLNAGIDYFRAVIEDLERMGLL